MNMLLSLVIEHTTQIIFPALQLCRLVEPVLTEHRKNIKLNNRTHPLIGTARCLTAAKLAMSYLESTSEGFVICDFFV